jgi:TPR repeat protein
MAIEHEHGIAMCNLARLYYSYYKEYDKAEKYYLMAIDYNYVDAMNELAILYEYQYKNYNKAKKYYLMAIEHNNINALNNLDKLYIITLKQYEKYHTYRNFFKKTFDHLVLYNKELNNKYVKSIYYNHINNRITVHTAIIIGLI